MKAILVLLCIVASAYAVVPTHDLVYNQWVAASEAGENYFEYVLTPSNYADKGLMLYVKLVAGSSLHTIEVKHMSHAGTHDSGLSEFDEKFVDVASSQLAVTGIPGAYWVKAYGGDRTVDYTLRFNVTSDDVVQCYLTYTDAINSRYYLSINGSEAADWAWGPSDTLGTGMVAGSVYVLGIQMFDQLDHYYLRATITINQKPKWGHAYMYNPTDPSIDDDRSIGTLQDQVTVRTCVWGSDCFLTEDKTYFIKMKVRAGEDTDTTNPQFTISFHALNGAAGVTVSIVLLIAMIALALL